ncbi:MAG: cell wall-binding repeat-containing protein [Peptococcaceae bacterium]|nr:cell wall-binding repeat-containing protein [Peptococcaceae bacterium]
MGNSSDFSAGGGHNLFDPDNKISGWGLNNDGQIGDGSTYHCSQPQTAVLEDGSIYYRLGGSNRIETANMVSLERWNYGANAVVLARDDDFPDALTGAPLAKAVDAPILLTNKEKLTPETKSEIERLNPVVIYILGSTGAVSDQIEKELTVNYKVIRLGGNDRYETSANIAKYLDWNKLNTKGQAIIAYGGNFPDALAVSSVAAFQKIPILVKQSHVKIGKSGKKQLLLGMMRYTMDINDTNIFSFEYAMKINLSF